MVRDQTIGFQRRQRWQVSDMVIKTLALRALLWIMALSYKVVCFTDYLVWRAERRRQFKKITRGASR
jgi:hypothetical protein